MSLSTLRSPPRLHPAADRSPRRSPRNHQPENEDIVLTQVTLARTLEEVIADSSLYMERAQFFQLAQDEGIEMSEVEELSYSSRLAKPKRKAKNIAFGNRFYPQLYTLAAHLWDVMETNRFDFPNMPKGGSNKSTYLHDIGKEIAQERKEYARADIHGIGDAGDDESCMDLIASSDKPKVFILKQSTLLARLRNKYGPLPESKRPTVDDKVRVMGVLFMSSSLREYLPDMLGKTKGGNRANLDASSARKRAGFRGLWMAFIDPEKVVVIPEEWTSGNTESTVNQNKGDGMYDLFGRFDPNNKNHIALPWTEKEVAAIFQAVMSEYNPAMHNWMKGTGGGSGAPEDFSIWEQRDPLMFINYSNQAARMYLSVVYIWDKKYQFILVTQKDTVPSDAVIDDDVLFGSGNDDDEDGGDDEGGRRGGGESGGRGRRSAATRKEDGIVSILNAMRSHRDEANLTSSELLETLKGLSPRAGTASTSHRPELLNNSSPANDSTACPVHLTMTRMKAASEYLDESTKKLNTLQKKRESLLAKEGRSKKVKTLEQDIQEQKAEVKVLRAAKSKHRANMESLCKSNESENDDDDDAIASDLDSGDEGSSDEDE